MPDEIDYLRSQLDQLTGQVIKADSVVSRAKRELGQRRKALALLSELHRTVRADMPAQDIARLALTAVSGALKMDRAAFLQPQPDGHYAFAFALGISHIPDARLTPPADLLTDSGHRLVTASTPPGRLGPFDADLRAALELPYFVAAPVLAGAKCIGLLVAGRLREQKPFYPPLDDGDLATCQAAAGFLGAAIDNAQLFHRTKRLADSAARFVPAEFLQLLGRNDLPEVALGDQTRLDLTVLFSDIRGFTTLSEQLSPEQTFRFVNAYLGFAAPVIRRYGGFIDKYIGDAIMALFPGAPAESALGALHAAIELQAAAQRFAQAPPVPLPGPLHIGVGVHRGPVMLGTIGYHLPTTEAADARLDCTVIADAVNLASRLESITKTYGASLICSAEVLAPIPPERRPAHRLIDRVRVKGKSGPVDLLDVFAADADPERQLKSATAVDFAVAVTAYTAGDFPAAVARLTAVLAHHPADTAARLLLARAHTLAATPPPDWQGITALDAK